MKYETTYSIGDVVYISDEYNNKKEFVTAIKIIGETTPRVFYGVKEYGISLFSRGGDGYNWYPEDGIFTDARVAESNHNKLKAEKEAKEAREAVKQHQLRIIKARADLEKLEKGIDPDDDDDSC